MPNLGATLFERQAAHNYAQSQELERQKALKVQADQQAFDRLMRTREYELEREDREFNRRYKVAELHGKLASMRGDKVAPKMSGPATQEMADVSFGIQGQELPQMEKELRLKGDLDFQYKMPFELLDAEIAQAKMDGDWQKAQFLEQGRAERFQQSELGKEDRFTRGQVAQDARQDRALGSMAWRQGRQLDQQREIFGLGLADKQQARTDKGVVDMGKEMESLGNMREPVARLSRLLNDSDPIAGTGVLRGRLPDFMVSAEGAQNRADLGMIVGELQKDLSGLSSTEQEAVRITRRALAGETLRDDQLRVGIQNAVAAFNRKLMQRTQKFAPSVRETYSQRVGPVDKMLIDMGGPGGSDLDDEDPF